MNAAILTVLAVLFIPQSNDETLSQTPLENGEAAFIMRDGAATLKIGGADVIDRTALRGYRVDTLDRADFTVKVDGGFTYNGTLDSWTLATTGGNVLTNHVVITTLNDIYNVSVDAKFVVSLTEGNPIITKEIDGNTATITMIWPYMTENAVVKDVVLSVVAFGDPDEITDLKTHHFRLVDTIGSLELGNWRAWARDLYTGNRGADWSKYAAVQNVDMNGHKVVIDAKAHYSFGLNADTNIVMTAGGYSAFELSHHGTTIETNMAIRITSFAVTNLTCYIGFVQDIASFDISKLSVFETYSLTKPIVWTQVASGDISSKVDGMVVVNPQPGYRQRFLKLVYDGSIETTIVTLTMNGIVCVTGDLAINGTNLVAWMKAVDSPLAGRQFDFAKMKGMYEAVSNIVFALGGSITNYPAFNQ